MTRFTIAAVAALVVAGCAAPAASSRAAHRAALTHPGSSPASSPAPVRAPLLTAPQQRRECARLRAASKVPDASAPGNAKGFWGVEWLIVARYQTDIAGAFAVLSKAVATQCPSLSWTLQQMQQ